MKKLFFTMAFLPTLVFGDFLQENDFWWCLENDEYECAEKSLVFISEHEVYTEEDGIRLTLLFIAYRAAKGDINLTKWDIDKAVSYLSSDNFCKKVK